TTAYTFTDYKSQGQTLECVIVDIAKPPSGSLTAFNAYIALSRSRGRKQYDFCMTSTTDYSQTIRAKDFEQKTTISLVRNVDARLLPFRRIRQFQ
ncbi:hypothetical protein EDB84DRAFT_1281004, partial [Lactarius hengduanensis]